MGRNPFIDDMAGDDDEDDINDYDDLDIAEVVKNDLKKSTGYIASVNNGNAGSDTEEEDSSEETNAPSPTSKAKASPVRPSRSFNADKIDGFSDDDDGEDPYLAFKNRRLKKRKRVVETRKPSKTRPVTVISNSKKKDKEPINPVVGKRTAPKARHRRETVWKGADDHIDPDDLLDDEQLPDYVKSRKGKFEAVQDRLGTAGLKLPPIYDDIYFSDDERLEDLTEKPSLPTLKPCAPYKDITLKYSGGIIPAPIAQWLRGYQVQGAQFLHELFVWQRGGILGDDMGLGKTIQVISFLTAAFGKTADERDQHRMRKIRKYDDNDWYPRVLIMCPGTLMENWKAELDRWGWWNVDVYHGSTRDKEATLSAAAGGNVEIMITTYSTYRLNQSAINTIEWDCVVADECHAIKGHQAEITKAMNEINALCRIGLTGTAIQNNYDELWTLLNWTNPGKFGSLASWKNSISNPLKNGQSHTATAYQLGLARRTAYKLVNNLLPQFFLRRMKSLIADQLPKKSDRVVFCPLTDTQADAYANYVDSDLVQFIRGATDLCDCNSGKKRGWCCSQSSEEWGDWRTWVFPLIMTLQKLSSNLALIVPKRDDSKEKIDKDIEHLKMAVPDAWERLFNNSGHMTSDANQEFCGKWKVLKKLLRFWYGNGDKVLIFSHSVRLLKMLHVLFTRDENNYNVSYLDGSLSYVDRAAVVDDFNANPGQFVFLISTRAGGVGLNITSANKVVVMDPNWNPAHDLQAQDRAYRIGQLRDVEVFRLISIGTIEEIVYARQIYKQQQANIGYTASSERRYFTGVQDNKDKKGEIFGLNNLFRYQGDGVVLQDIVNKTNVAESRMGVAVADIDLSHISSDDGDALGDEESVMRNIDALIEEGGGDRAKSIQKINPIAAILSSVGVKYTHENSEVIGTSKTEARISRKAAENTTITGPDSRPVFEYSELRTGGVQYKYNPTEDVRRRQFCTMAKMFGIANATEFALLVEGWTQEQRRNCLEKFYRMRREALLGDSGTSGDASGLSTHGLVRVAAMEMKDELANFNGYNTTTIVKDHNDDDMTDDEL